MERTGAPEQEVCCCIKDSNRKWVCFFFSLDENVLKTFMFLKNEAGQRTRGGRRGEVQGAGWLLAHLCRWAFWKVQGSRRLLIRPQSTFF